MFTSSIRRVVTSASPSTTSSLTNNLPRAVTSSGAPFTPRFHQRRASSSKPSSPADGSKGVVRAQSVVSTTAESSPKQADVSKTDIEEKPLPNKRKTRSVSGKSTPKIRNSFLNIPSVPSTQYITPSLLGPASFFSLHRPISITNGFPQPVTEEAFASIFTSKSRNNKPSEVVSTLSNTLDALDSVTGRLETMDLDSQKNDQWRRIDEIHSGIIEDPSTNSGESILSTPKHFTSDRYAPFNPPPAPVPMSTAQIFTAESASRESQESRHRIYTAVLTVEESTDFNGDVTYMAHHSPLVVEENFAPPDSFTSKTDAQRTRNTSDQATQDEISAISVKRQRKLKMKKHKYKKLMRRTRNLRRRQDRN